LERLQLLELNVSKQDPAVMTDDESKEAFADGLMVSEGNENDMLSNSSVTMDDSDAKIMQFLSTLSCWIALYESTLSGTTFSTSPNEALITVIGYLKAYVPCLTDLIEAAPQGALKEITFEQCLLMNDKLTSVLANVVDDHHDYREEGLPPALNAALKTPEEDRVDDDERYSLHGNDVAADNTYTQRHSPLNDDAAEVLARARLRRVAHSNQQPRQVSHWRYIWRTVTLSCHHSYHSSFGTSNVGEHIHVATTL
jgi:hypothetical protein